MIDLLFHFIFQAIISNIADSSLLKCVIYDSKMKSRWVFWMLIERIEAIWRRHFEL